MKYHQYAACNHQRTMISSHQREGGAEVDTPPYKINEMRSRDREVGVGFDGRRTDIIKKKKPGRTRLNSKAESQKGKGKAKPGKKCTALTGNVPNAIDQQRNAFVSFSVEAVPFGLQFHFGSIHRIGFRSPKIYM